jgi:flagellar hook assembly protein FlgD
VTRVSEIYPNPFNPQTTIKYDLARQGHVSVAVFDLAGRLVHQLLDESVAPGHHEVTWRGRDSRGRTAAAGVYFVRLKTADTTDTRRMTLVK